VPIKIQSITGNSRESRSKAALVNIVTFFLDYLEIKVYNSKIYLKNGCVDRLAPLPL
jgi:hypothetical protein